MYQLHLRNILGICGDHTQWKSYQLDGMTMSHLFVPSGARKGGDLRELSIHFKMTWNPNDFAFLFEIFHFD